MASTTAPTLAQIQTDTAAALAALQQAASDDGDVATVQGTVVTAQVALLAAQATALTDHQSANALATAVINDLTAYIAANPATPPVPASSQSGMMR
jgi:hypothetical protein